MKKFMIIGLSVVVVVACILLLWQHVKISRDRSFSEKLAGAWSWGYANIRGTWEFAPDGSFIALDSYSNRTNTYQMSGTWHIQDGRFLETITNDNHKRAQIPRTNSVQIISMDAHAFVVGSDTNRLILKRITP